MKRFAGAIGLLLLIAALACLFPDALREHETRMHALYLVVLLTAMSAGIGRSLRRRPPSKQWRDAAIWLSVFALLACAYRFRDMVASWPD